jgi:hypothetical protein
MKILFDNSFVFVLSKEVESVSRSIHLGLYEPFFFMRDLKREKKLHNIYICETDEITAKDIRKVTLEPFL